MTEDRTPRRAAEPNSGNGHSKDADDDKARLNFYSACATERWLRRGSRVTLLTKNEGRITNHSPRRRRPPARRQRSMWG